MTKEISDKTFKQEVLEKTLPVIVKFWASWCPPCKVMEPMIESLEKQIRGQAIIVNLNADKNPFTTAHYNVKGLPTLIFFKNGEEKARLIGAQGPQTILNTLETI
ncbi:thioredoxin [archaeon CG10_big_fil_rev_8_21_14_0_10_43_11]|nr:MAG: thioredoxin [archaeon CG10_big_fil_rev_8_21_14_0_10_43_11]